MGQEGRPALGLLGRTMLMCGLIAATLCAPLYGQSLPQNLERLSAVFDGAAWGAGHGAPVEGFAAPAAPAVHGAPAYPGIVGAPVTLDRGAELLKTLHQRSRSGHVPLSYSEAKRRMFSKVDNVTLGGVRGVTAAYSEIFVAGTSEFGGEYPERGDLNRDGYVDKDGMNAEHIWPQSFFKQREPMRSDLFQLLPTFMHPNSVRGHLPFGEVTGSADYRNSAGAKRGGGVFGPPDSVKGRVARALFYFYTRYLGTNIIPRDSVEIFWNRRIEMLLRWNREYPPDALERRRNDLIEEVQGNRNPYVDDPGLADRVGEQAFHMSSKGGAYASSDVKPRLPPASRLENSRLSVEWVGRP